MENIRDYTGTIEAYDLSFLIATEDELIRDILSSQIRKEDVISMRLPLDKIIEEQVITQHNVVTFRRHLGVRGHLMDLSLGDATIPTLNHYSCLLNYALHLIESGHQIHLIEATDCFNKKKMADIDLLSSKNDKIFLHDYTQRQTESDGPLYRNLIREEAMDKYDKLDEKFMRDTESVVVTGPKDDRLSTCRIEVEVYKGCPFDADLDFYDSVMEHVDEMTITEAQEVITDYADRAFDDASYSGSKYLSSAPPCKTFFASHKDELSDLLKHNNPHTGAIFDEFQEGLETESCKRDYFNDYYHKIMDCQEKSIFLQPLPGRITEYNLSAYDRLKQIKDDLGTECSSFIDLILLSEKEGVHPTNDELNFLKTKADYSLIEGLKVERLKRSKSGEKGELMSAIRLFYPISLKRTMKSFIYNKEQLNKYKEGLTTCENSQQLEEKYDRMADMLGRPCDSSRFTDDLRELSSGILTGEGLSKQVKNYVMGMVEESSNTRIGNYLSFLSELTIAMSNAQRRKFSCESIKGSIKSNQMIFSLDAVSDRYCVVLTGMNLKLGEIGDQTYCTISSSTVDMPEGLPNIRGVSRWSNMSSEDTNWNLVMYHKYLSWVTYVLESKISSSGKYEKILIKDHVIMPAMMMLINSLGFAQTSEAIRYLYMGSVGMSTDQYKIIEKIMWYTPNTFVEKLYVSRMIKMISFLSLAKSNNVQASLYLKTESSVHYSDKEFGKSKFRTLAVAFPNESVAVLRDDHAYNMFYLCRAFQLDRQGELLGESLIVEKQKEAREEYLRIKSLSLQHEARFRPIVLNKTHLMNLFLSEDYSTRKTDVYSANALVVILGYVVTLLKYKRDGDKTLLDINKRVYDIDNRDQFTELSSIMNNRGSLRRSGPTGVTNFREEKKKVEGKEFITTMNQNSKSYETLLQLAHDFVDDVNLPSVKEMGAVYDSTKDKPVERGLSTDFLIKLCNMPDNLSMIQQFCISKKSLFVSKGTHKGDIAVREIATLNAPAKVCAKVAEDFARNIRDNEHGQGDTTNLIEIQDKDEIFKRDYVRSLHIKSPEMTLHDSADCSKWGPGMMSPTLYFVVASRMRNKAKKAMLRNFFFLFSQRLFKLPDRLYKHAMSKTTIIAGSGSKVEQISDWIRSNEDLELCNTKMQYFPLEEGMYQGILGNCSSCLAADASRLNDHVQQILMKEISFKSQTKVTSDDYNRLCVFIMGIKSISEVTRYSTGITMINQLNFGIRRNKQKSTMSTTRSELNSKYLDETGDYKPDIKSRLSYVDFDHSQDMVPSAVRASSLSAEYLRSEGSLIGAVITQLLNTHLHVLKHGIRPLLRQVGSKIFLLPLEFGGLIRIDPILAVCTTEYASLIDNYSLGKTNPELAIKFLDEMTPKEVSTISTDVDDSSLKSMVPRMSRSGVIHLSKREKRSLRSMREMLNATPNEWFSMLKYPGSPSLLKALISCIKREESNEDSSIRSKSFSACQTNKDAKLYRLNSPFIIELMNNKKNVSRQELFNKAMEFLHSETDDLETKIQSKPINLPFDFKEVKQTIMDYRDYIRKSEIVSIGNVKIKTSNHRSRLDFFPTGSVENMLQDFQVLFKPKILGGSSDVTPMVYLESEMMFREKVLKLSRRKQTFNFTMIGSDEGEKYMPRMILTAGFSRGTRPLIETKDHFRIERRTDDKMLETILTMNSIKTSPTRSSAIAMDPLNSHFPTVLKSGRLKRMDLTNVYNACNGNCETFSFSSPDVKQSFLESLTSLMTDLRYEGFIKPKFMKPDRLSYEYKLSGSDLIYQRPMLSEGNRVIGTETILKRGKKYFHNLVKYAQGSIIRMEDTVFDKYKYIDLSVELTHPISIWLYYGYVCVTINIDNKKEIIDILGTSIKSLLNTYTIICPGSLVNHYNSDELILRKHRHDIVNEYEHSPIEHELGFYPDELSTAAPSVVDDDEELAMMDELSDIASDGDIMDFMMQEGDEEEEGSYYEEEGEYYEDDDESAYNESHFSATLSRESGVSARYVLNHQKMISRSSIYYLNTAMGVKLIDRRRPPWKDKYDRVGKTKQVYEIQLPFELSKATWEADGEEDALLNIISDVSKDLDSTWKLDYLIETILHSHDLMHERKNVGLF